MLPKMKFLLYCIRIHDIKFIAGKAVSKYKNNAIEKTRDYEIHSSKGLTRLSLLQLPVSFTKSLQQQHSQNSISMPENRVLNESFNIFISIEIKIKDGHSAKKNCHDLFKKKRKI